MIRQLLVGVVGAVVVGVGLWLIASVSAGGGVWTPLELIAAFLLLVVGGVAMASAVA